MIAKLFIIALLSVALVQGQDGLENAIKTGLSKLKTLRDSAERRINGGIAGVEGKTKSINARTPQVIANAEKLETLLLKSLDRTAQELGSKVPNRPSVLDCIEKARSSAASRIQNLQPKFVEDMNRLTRTKLENIQTASNPFPGIQKDLETKYEKARVDLTNAKTTVTVRQVIARATREFETLYAEVRRIQSNVNIIFTNYSKDSNLFYNNLSRQANQIQAFGSRQMRECLSRRDTE